MSDEDKTLDVKTTKFLNVEQLKAFEELKPLLFKFMSANKVKLTDNPEQRLRVITALCDNKIKKGKFYCPCKFVPVGQENNAKFICPCNTAMLDVKKRGACTCNLFVKI